MYKLLFYVCLMTLFGLAFAYLCGYLSARVEAKFQQHEAESNHFHTLLAQEILKYEHEPEPTEHVVDLEWLQHNGFTSTEAERWVN